MPKKRTDDKYDWRELSKGSGAKKTRRKPIAWPARLRTIWIWTKVIFAAALLGAASWGIFEFCRSTTFDDFLGNGEKISRIEFKTDGVISGAWLNSYLKIPRGSTLADVNIFETKEALDSLSQIKSSKVERIYPDVLRITVSEHKPMTRVSFAVNGETRVYMMTETGEFFRPICRTDAEIAKYTEIDGITAVFDGSTPKSYSNAGKLKEFLEFAQKNSSVEFSRWKLVDVGELESATLPLIVAVRKDGVRIVFQPQDYKKQFDRLDYITRYMADNPMKSVEKIDLTLKDWSVVKFAPEKSK